MDFIRFKPRLKATAKVIGHLSLIMVATIGLTWATLDDQVDKASTLVLGKVATLVVGGATLFGGAYAAIQQNVGKGIAIITVGALTGIGIALAKSGTLFTLLQ